MMPAKRPGLMCRHIFTFVVVLLSVPAGMKAQTGGVTMQGTVSEIVALSVLPTSTTTSDVETSVMSTGSTVRITLSGAGAEAQVIRVPLLVRSNSSFKI